ncbi:DNA replication/repair protein RecF [Candidatus Peregrinibacteria bacterium]|nr:DNA replication/repair protein RecF [Candidatus Peregrinibacteria bacterium]
MILEKITLARFRNHESFELKPDAKTTVIIGPNARGKTNILEAIYLMALSKSFRTNKQSDLILWDQDYCRVTGEFTKDRGETISLEVFFGNPPNPKRALKVNGVKVSPANFIGNCQIVFFHPEDLNILYLGPDLRRKYLDVLNLQVNKAYYKALSAYRRVLKHRNALLKGIKEGASKRSDLEVWDEQLAIHGKVLLGQRIQSVNFLNEWISAIYNEIGGKNDTVALDYQSTIKGDYMENLSEVLERDIQAGFTTRGPHRDDLHIYLNERLLSEHASRGEYRSLLLGLKLLEMRFYENQSGEKPILLLDDVFSELDNDRQDHLMKAIKGYQAILTTTHFEAHIKGQICELNTE